MSAPLPAEDEVPDALTSRDQWLCWGLKNRDGKMTKVPIDPGSDSFGSTTDPDTWGTFDEALDCAHSSSTDADGIGFVFTERDPIVGVDLDDCRTPESGRTREWATDVIDRLDSYTEVSPSGTGYHVLVRGELPAGRNRKGDLELYETARFFTVTGDHVDGTPKTIETRTEALATIHREYLHDDEETTTDNRSKRRTAASSGSLADRALLDRATNAANGEKFGRLWRGVTSGYDSHSEADMALCSLLAFWTGGDAAQMDRLFRDSGLMRQKWDEQHFADGSTYGEKTIERSIDGTSEFYEPTDTPLSDEPVPIEGGHESEASPNGESVRQRETERLERISELESKLNDALDTIERLETDLNAERKRRVELEQAVATKTDVDSGDGSSWLPWS